MYCYNCGKQIPDNANFCRYCGASQAIINGGGAGGIPAFQDSSQPSTQSSESQYSYAGQQSSVQAQTQTVPPLQPNPQQTAQQPQLPPVQQPQAAPQAQPLQQSQTAPQPQMPLTQPSQAAPQEQYQTAQQVQPLQQAQILPTQQPQTAQQQFQAVSQQYPPVQQLQTAPQQRYQTAWQQPQQQTFQQPFPQSQPFSAPPSSNLLASQPCSYKVAPEADFKKFEFGGMPEGTVEIYDDRLELFSKSKMVKLAFGMIGSVLSGKGKADLTISDYMVRRDTINNNMKNVFRFYLTDGRLAYIQLNGLTGQQEARNAMRRFLRM